MAKPKSPLLSLGARGTIADALTYQKRGREHIVREKPIPRDPYSLGQAYQRWDYRDYAYLWTLLTNSEKQVYRTRASRYHITGFSLWMREHLKELPDLAGRWHLDKIIGGQVLDSSKNTNHGTVFGATLTDGVISKALSFDGLDDFVRIPDIPPLRFGYNPFSIELFLYVIDFTLSRDFCRQYLLVNTGYFELLITNTKRPFLMTRSSDTNEALYFSPSLYLTLGWNHLALTRTDPLWTFYVNSASETYTDTRAAREVTFKGWQLGAKRTYNFWLGSLDHLIIYNRALDATEAKRHSERRYP